MSTYFYVIFLFTLIMINQYRPFFYFFQSEISQSSGGGESGPEISKEAVPVSRNVFLYILNIIIDIKTFVSILVEYRPEKSN